MNLTTKSVLSIRWMLRGAEWAILLMLMLLYALDSFHYTSGQVLSVIGFSFVFFLLSFAFPIERPAWQRRAYVALEMVLIIITSILGIEFSVLLYFLLVKSCFLLSRREVLFTVFTVGVGYLLGFAWSLPWLLQMELEHIRSRGLEALYQPSFVVLGRFIEYLGISVFVILVGFIIVAERKSRQRAEALAQEVEALAANLERTRIARDIHDALGHTLTTLGVQLEVAQKLRQRNPAQALQALDTAKLLTDQCLEDVRRALQTVRQSDFNLNQALVALVEQLGKSQSFTISTNINLPSLPLQTNQHLYRIVQEGLTNIQKHANASDVRLRTWTTVNSIHLTLSDNGQGFDPKGSGSGFGLQGMRERAHILGGDLKIISTPDRGTQIQVIIPR